MLSLLLHQFAKTGQDKFASLFNLIVSERTKSIQEYSRGSFVGLGGFGKCTLEFGLGHFVAVGYARNQRPASPKFFETSNKPNAAAPQPAI